MPLAHFTNIRAAAFGWRGHEGTSGYRNEGSSETKKITSEWQDDQETFRSIITNKLYNFEWTKNDGESREKIKIYISQFLKETIYDRAGTEIDFPFLKNYRILCNEFNNSKYIDSNVMIFEIYLENIYRTLRFTLTVPKQIKRIYSEVDPYGEEAWED